MTAGHVFLYESHDQRWKCCRLTVRRCCVMLFLAAAVVGCSSRSSWDKDRKQLEKRLANRPLPPKDASFIRSYSASPGIQIIYYLYGIDRVPVFSELKVLGGAGFLPESGLNCDQCKMPRSLAEGDLVLENRSCTVGLRLEESTEGNRRYTLVYAFRCEMLHAD